MPNVKKILLTLDLELYARLQEAAAYERRPLAQLARLLIEDGIDKILLQEEAEGKI